MTTITIHVRDQENANFVLRLLESLNIVDDIETSTNERIENNDDFFALAGLWEDRDISIESIRERAWDRQ